MSNAIGPVSLKERIEILDVLRAFAVCGILIGNMQWFSGYGMMPPAVAQRGATTDQLTHFLVHLGARAMSGITPVGNCRPAISGENR